MTRTPRAQGPARAPQLRDRHDVLACAPRSERSISCGRVLETANRGRDLRLRLTSALAAAGVTGVVAVLSAGAGAVYGSVAVFPAAGTPVASPNTQISFRGASPAELSGVKVRGSKSGSHSGKLRVHSDGLGASFLPDHPFHAGER